MKKKASEKAAALMAIRPEYVEKIAEGTKTFELRRKIGQEFVERKIPTIAVYSSAPTQRIVGLIEVLKVHHMSLKDLWRLVEGSAGISYIQYQEYFKGVSSGYAIEILRYIPTFYSTLSELGITRPPQNYQFINETQLDQILSKGLM
ncbi:protein of unknown function DUF437 [Methanolacinia petrolearia DSM 11571]|uniref:ASCH domain-containing protein n=1 Tax=Methanolacinia petrolearia (strain DSM 11571 / OCM 486 / SEBR 4847) TaxID=679926 RepID=E1RD63_METP4|nr:ASCH domain-containing protein [Methanolacinia petrolearia]ADN37046.1 protein of unknown function DUF437 [Methanolacinia petrolearia DSM 11571]